MSKADKIAAFDPNGAAEYDALFGLPFSPDECDCVVIAVPWDATASYSKGTAHGPQAVLEASQQVDLYDAFSPDGWQQGIGMINLPQNWLQRNRELSEIAHTQAGAEQVNRESEALTNALYETAQDLLKSGKLVAVLGGEHSAPLGLIKAVAEKHPGVGILHMDAHLDYRIAYEGFQQSHASIMYNATQLKGVGSIVSVGIRDYCHQEKNFAASRGSNASVHYMRSLREAQYNGASWQAQVAEIIQQLPQEVYISFDIDVLEPHLCPNTGTPVPGGLQFDEATYLVRSLANAGKRIVGFDLCEVAPGNEELPPSMREWDGNVGARILYQLALAALKSNQ